MAVNNSTIVHCCYRQVLSCDCNPQRLRRKDRGGEINRLTMSLMFTSACVLQLCTQRLCTIHSFTHRTLNKASNSCVTVIKDLNRVTYCPVTRLLYFPKILNCILDLLKKTWLRSCRVWMLKWEACSPDVSPTCLS